MGSGLGASARRNPSRTPIRAKHAKVYTKLFPGTERLRDRVLHSFAIVGMDRAQEVLPVRRSTCKAEQLCSLVRKPYSPGSLVDCPKARPRGSCRQIQPLFAFAQGRFGPTSSTKLRK